MIDYTLSDAFIFVIITYVIGVVYIIFKVKRDYRKTKELDKLRSDFAEVKKLRENSDNFYYAISILKDSRFSYVLCENGMIEIKALEHTYDNLNYIKVALDVFCTDL